MEQVQKAIPFTCSTCKHEFSVRHTKDEWLRYLAAGQLTASCPLCGPGAQETVELTDERRKIIQDLIEK